MTISLVVAASENNVIGKDNRLLWHLPNDMKFFKNTTWGMPVIMGRKTFESLGKPLTGRTNIVMTRDKDWAAKGTTVSSNMEEAIKAAAETDAKEVFVIGGGEIYKQVLPQANRVYLTRVHTKLEGDAFFLNCRPKTGDYYRNLILQQMQNMLSLIVSRYGSEMLNPDLL